MDQTSQKSPGNADATAPTDSKNPWLRVTAAWVRMALATLLVIAGGPPIRRLLPKESDLFRTSAHDAKRSTCP